MKSMDSNVGLAEGSSLKSVSKAGTNRVGVTTSKVVAQLRRRILEGDYSYEERLPAERNLAEEFKRMPLGLDRIRFGFFDPADNGYRGCLDFIFLPPAA